MVRKKHIRTILIALALLSVSASAASTPSMFPWTYPTTFATEGGWIPRETATTHQTVINESAYEQLDDSMNAANPSWTDFTDAIANPYINMMGSIFFLFLFGVPLLMLYIRQDSMNIPATFVFMFGAFILVLLPPQWQIIGGGLLALALFGAYFSFMKERERG